MRAVLQQRAGGPEELVVVELPDPEPGPGQVGLAVEAAGAHLVDTNLRRGEAGPAGTPVFPVIPGREVAGTVDRLGEGVDESWRGQRVVVHLGVAGGGYASRAVADADQLFAISDHVGAAEAVAAVGTGRTVLAVLDLAQPGPDDVVVVTGAGGGMGLLLVQASAAAGATVIALAGAPAKLAAARDQGAALAVDHREPDWADRVRTALDGRSVTLALDGVGGEHGRSVFDLVAPGGRMVLFGYADGAPMPLTAGDLFTSGVTVSAAVGARMLSTPGAIWDLAARSLARLERGTWRPVVHEPFPLDDAPAAHRAMEERTAIGKVVLVP